MKDDNGMTALHHAIDVNHTAVIDWLIANGAKLNKPDDKNKLPLHIAAEKGNGPAVEKLVRRGSPLQAKVNRVCVNAVTCDMSVCTCMICQCACNGVEI